MKKKLFLSLFVVFACLFTFIGGVNATTAKAPSAIPDENDTLYAILDDQFDFSKISFKSATEGGENIVGHNYMKKIMLTANPVLTGTTKTEKLGESWFTVYCLDGQLKFPMYSITNFTFTNGMSDEIKLQAFIMFSLFNNIELNEVFKTVSGYTIDPSITYTLNEGTVADALAKLTAGQEVSLKIQKIDYTNTEMQTKTITAADLSKTAGTTDYDLTLTPANLLFDKYTAKKMSGNDYNHALWIIEHSYPTLDIATSLSLAGANHDNLVTEIKTLHNGETHTDEEWEALVENYVYSTVQYAIWKVNGGIDLDGAKLGNSLVGSTQLNLLYTYLIIDRSEYTNYSSLQFTNTLALNQPAAGKEIKEETKDYYLYGPYSVKADLISVGDINIAVGNTDKTGISIVDEDGNVITKVSAGQKFFVKCTKSSKTANVTINLTTNNALTFYPSSNRGRIYYAHYPLTQNVVSGGKIVNVDIEKSFDLVYNPKTGVENIAIIFVVTLIAFSLGYLAISYKNKPVELN